MPLSTKRAYAQTILSSSERQNKDNINNTNNNNNNNNNNNIPRNLSFKLNKTSHNNENNNSFSSSDSDANSKSELDNGNQNTISPFNLTKELSSYNIDSDDNYNDDGDKNIMNHDHKCFSFNNYNYNSNNNSSSNNIERKKSNSFSFSSTSQAKRNITPKIDLIARERCFDYIVQAIDEVWARYCDTTSSAEAEVYGSWNIKRQKLMNGCPKKKHFVDRRFSDNMKSMNCSGNVNINNILGYNDDDDCYYEDSDRQIFDHNKQNQQDDVDESSFLDDDEDDDDESDDSGYKSEATNITEYETDSSEYRTVSKLPDSMKLQSLKRRLTNAKNDLELCYDSLDYFDSVTFWNRWDMIKYSAVEVMEDDDDDEIVEEAIEELERGRCLTE